MIKGYVSSDEDDDDNFGYSEPLPKKPEQPSIPEIHSEKLRGKLNSAIEDVIKRSQFLQAALRGDLEALEEFISSGLPVDSNAPNKWPALMQVCQRTGDVTVVRFLLEHGSNPNQQIDWFTPLLVCCYDSSLEEDLKLECLRVLIEYGADVNVQDKYGATCLMYACGNGYFDIICELLTTPGIDVNKQDKEGWSALFYAVSKNDKKIVGELLSAGINLELKDRFYRNAMNLAVERGMMELAKILGHTEVVPDAVKTEINLAERFLKELPQADGQGGFPSDAKSILTLFNHHNVKNIDFPELLNITEDKLQEIGVKVKYSRRKFLAQAIHRYHLHPWTKTSIPNINGGVPLSTHEIIILTGDIAKHLTIANASLRYLDSRISSRQNTSLNIKMEQSLILCLIKTYVAAEETRTFLSRMMTHSDQMKLEISPDYIHKYEENTRMNFKKYFWCTVSVAVAGGFLLRYFSPPFLG